MAGIDVARHGLELARVVGMGVGVGPLSTALRAEPVRLVGRRGRVRRWPAAALLVSLLGHGVAVMMLLSSETQPLALPSETSFQLVFEPPAPSVAEAPVPEPAPPAVVGEVPGAAEDEMPVAQQPPPVPASEPQDVSPPRALAPEPQDVPSPPAQALAPEPPAVKIPEPQAAAPQAVAPKDLAPQVAAPKASAVPGRAVRRVAPRQRSVEAPQSSAPPGAASPQVATGAFVPPSPVAGMETNQAPVYPQSALRRGEQGNVMLRVSVSADGAPLAVDLAATSGHASLDNAAEAAVRRWRFNPATRGGIPVAAMADVPIRFRLAN